MALQLIRKKLFCVIFCSHIQNQNSHRIGHAYCEHQIQLGIIHYFQHFRKSTESTLGGGGKSSCTLSKLLDLATVLVHETSLANQHFWGEGMGM